jgi:hypothetical protein
MEIKPKIRGRAAMLRHALQYWNLGWSVMPLHGKKPAIGSWKHLQQERPTIGLLHHWFGMVNRTDFNLGVITGKISDLVVVDADSREVARWWESRFPATPLRCRTSKGAHFYFRHPGTEVRNGRHLLGRPIDIRGDGGYVVAPPSIHPETLTPYEWLPTNDAPWQCALDDLPMFEPSWLEAKSPPALPAARTADANVERARRYIGKIVAISGRGGHDATFRAACQLADRGFAEQQMLQLMLEWNETNAVPKWSEVEIRHKIHNALNRGASDATADSRAG